MILQKLYELDLINTPYWVPTNTQMLILTGSHSYGIETADSDFDYMGFCIPPKEYYFPCNIEKHIKEYFDNKEKLAILPTN